MKDSKIEIFHEQAENKSYFYDTIEKQLFHKNINITDSSNTKFSKLSAISSTTIGIFSIIVNRWYLSVGTTLSNIFLTLVTFILLIIFSKFIKKEIDKQNKIISNITFELTPRFDIKDVVEKSERLINFWTIIKIILIAMIVIGIPMFFNFNYLIGLVMFSIGIEGIFLIYRYLKLRKRKEAIKQIKKILYEYDI
ncbi:hypothetical protein ACMZ6Y_07730 [Streptococcus pluranimalium]